MRATGFICDRCGNHMVDIDRSIIKIPQDYDYHEQEIDLCQHCLKQFERFLKNVKPEAL